jgi:error-prone DNA polymerase
MARLFARWPHAIQSTREFADALDFSLDELKYEYPRETGPEGARPQAHLEHLAWEGARAALAGGIPKRSRNRCATSWR